MRSFRSSKNGWLAARLRLSDRRSPSVHSDMMRLGNEDPRYDVSNDPNEFILRQGASIVTVNTIFKAGLL